MKARNALENLAAVEGILPEYIDNWGRRHVTRTGTKKAILSAMGFDVATPQAIAKAAAQIDMRRWQRVLESVQVVRRSPLMTHVRMAKSRVETTITWRLLLEDGGKHGGHVGTEQLTQIESRDIDGVAYGAWELTLPVMPPVGYHHLELENGGRTLARQALIVAPPVCYQPEVLRDTGRVWGPSAQLYALRSERHWGMGDFTDLRLLTEHWAGLGADVIGLNPTHALFPCNPEHASPYSPSSRLYLNALYLDVEAIPDFHESEPAQALLSSPEIQLRMQQLRTANLVDYSGVSALKFPVLELLYRSFKDCHLRVGSDRAAAFEAFKRQEGPTLALHTLFEALQEFLHSRDPQITYWRDWPEIYCHPGTVAVQEFSKEHHERIDFFAYLQWQADLQMAAAGLRSLELGLGVGLYLDLAVAVDKAGADVWANQAHYAMGVSVGAPPETNNQVGQDWSLAPFLPQALRDAEYAPFIAVLRHNMRYAGALRIDHVMGLMRQFWVPEGLPPTAGAYVSYPFDDLLGILALESQRNRCLVVGEDLGTVPDAVRGALQPLGVLSYRVLIDSTDVDGNLVLPGDYPAQALATVATHDMPTLAGYWEGRDLLRRTELGLFGSKNARRTRVIARARERAQLLLALEEAELLPANVTVNPISLPAVTPGFAQAVHTYLARSPAKLLLIQLEDTVGVVDQINIPSSTTGYANWRRKLPINLEDLRVDHRILTLSAALQRERPRQPPPKRSREVVIPLATYRLQLSRDFTFSQAAQIVPYLATLGISHIYCSPYLRARPGSAHGYDIIDHTALNPEIGNRADFVAFCNTLRAHGMGQVADMVPNHMGVMGADNQWWLDVLEHGEASVYASFFDIDWQPLKAELQGKLLLPILARRYGLVLEAGELRLDFDRSEGSFSVWYEQNKLPVDPATYPRLLRSRYELLEARLGADDTAVAELASVMTALEKLPSRVLLTPEEMLERRRDSTLLKRRLGDLANGSLEIEHLLQDVISDHNGIAGESESFRLLHALLEVQPWRIADWHVASDEINYRRFFDNNNLAGLRMEDFRVFEATHHLVLDLVREGKVDGLRIDHSDGLYDPGHYFQRLQENAGLQSLPAGLGKALYVVAEKILSEKEPLRAEWAVHGTTGYDFCNLATRLFVDPRGDHALETIYRHFTNDKTSFDEMIFASKRIIMRQAMASEINVLTGQLSRICELDVHTRDYTVNNLRDALVELIVHFPVYRTYVRDGKVDSLDRRYVERAVAGAMQGQPAFDVSVLEFIASVLLLDAAVNKEEPYRKAVSKFAMKFQQLSGAVMAKGYEDTALYRYHRLIALNEVGSDPREFAISLDTFHAQNQKRNENWPHTMLNTSTHDAKHSEDFRARVSVISEIPERWQHSVRHWKAVNLRHKRQLLQGRFPSSNDEYLLYQTLLGSWPLLDMDSEQYRVFMNRILGYMLKAAREAKRFTSWIRPNSVYEDALTTFVQALMAEPDSNPFLTDFLPFQRMVTRWGLFNSLSQAFLKLTVPGVPDIYQGNELWTFDLADPDNRRPVDFALRRTLLAELEGRMGVPQQELASRVRQLLDNITDGQAKLYLTCKLLQVRRRWTGVFQNGSYQALETAGPQADHLCAFFRTAGETRLIAVAARFFARLIPEAEAMPLGETVWAETVIRTPDLKPGMRAVNELTGEEVEVLEQGGMAVMPANLLRSFPVALLRV